MKVIKQGALFLISGALYFLIECIWKGHLTHWSMFVVAGFAATIIGNINECIPWRMPLPFQCFIGMIVVTIFEGCAGVILNLYLNLNVWDYSHSLYPFFYGQCCVPFCCAWFFLSGLCIVLDDIIRWKLFGEEKPVYYLTFTKK